ncbi:MAG: DNA primase [Desulfobacterales bacterium]|nr:DNA primase [Desulfobacterales bacterium]
MAYILEESISAVLQTADIVDIISERIDLKKAGKNFIGLCPFHSEKTPSFTVSPDKQMYYCFGCHEGGNVISFLMKQEGIAFHDAVLEIAKRYGIDVVYQSMPVSEKNKINARDSLFQLNEQAMIFFQHQLTNSPSGKKAKLYLENRGITQNTIQQFRLGYALSQWQAIVNYINSKGISLTFAEKAGLIISKEKGGYYDRFRDRIMFPIFNIHHQIIGFGGRVIDEGEPKYLNSPETLVYNKRASLYGIQAAKDSIRKHKEVFIVEGYLDFLTLYQHGIQHVVATLGTALTIEHIRILKGMTKKIVLVFDSDQAGINAALRSVGLFISEHIEAKVLLLPSGYDPDEFVKTQGPQAFLDMTNQSFGLISFLLEVAIKKYGMTIEGKIQIVSELKPVLSGIDDSVVRSLYIQEISQRLGIELSAIKQMIDQVRGHSKQTSIALSNSSINQPQHNDQSEKVKNESDKKRSLTYPMERQIISMMLKYPKICGEHDFQNILSLFSNDSFKKLGHMLLAEAAKSNRNLSDILLVLSDGNHEPLAQIAELSIQEDDSVWSDKECNLLISKFIRYHQRRQNTLLEQIQVAEKNNDFKLLHDLLRQKQEQAKQRQ